MKTQKFYCSDCKTEHEIPTHEEWTGMIRECFPSATDEDIDIILWELTRYPFMGNGVEGFEHYKKQLQELSEKSNKDLGMAFEISYRELNEAMSTRKLKARSQ